MQLIVEPETTLDIEKTMSAVENIQNQNLETEDFTNTCNGNKQMEENNDSKKEMYCEIEAALANMHADIENNDAELSKVDLSGIISEKNSHEDRNVHTKESQSQNRSLENDTNGVNADEIENIEGSKEMPEENGVNADEIENMEESKDILEENGVNADKTETMEESMEILKEDGVNADEIENMKESEEISEEDYLEDDIISISAEPFKEISQSQKDSTDTIADKDETSVLESIFVDEKDNKEIPQIKSQSSIENNDVIEVMEDTEKTDFCEKESHMQEGKDEVEIIEKTGNTESQMQKEDHEVKLIEDSEDPSVQREKEGASKEEESSIMDVTMKPESSCENNTNLSNKELKQNDIGTTEQIEKSSSESKNKTVIPENDQVQIIKDAEDNSSRSENKTNSVIEESKMNTREENMDLPTEEKDDIEFMEEPDKHSAEIEDKTDTPKDAEVTTNGTEPMENRETPKDAAPKSPKCQPSREDDAMDIDESKTALESNDLPIKLKDDMDIEEVTDETISNNKLNLEPIDNATNTAATITAPVSNIIDKPVICKLSNTLDILSDDEDEELPKTDVKTSPKVAEVKENQSINIEDDDDIMLIDEDTSKTEPNVPVDNKIITETVAQPDEEPEKEKVVETSEKTVEEANDDLFDKKEKEESAPPPVVETKDTTTEIDIKEKTPEPKIDEVEPPLPLIPENFVKTAKKKLSDMTRDELEEFCILKIVESIVDRGSLTEIKNKLLSMTQALDEHRKKAMMLTKQNRDLQVVLKSVQEEQKKATGNTPITPLKITRSVGMQVYMEKTVPRKKGQQQNMNNKNLQNKNMMQAQGPRAQKQINQSIPVPRLVPAHNPALKNPNTVPQISQMNTPTKANPANGIIKNPSPVLKSEKRPYNKIGSSVTVDLTDDEPPTKMPGGPRTSPAPPVRLVPPQNLMGPRFGTSVNSPRKVYIPISGPQNQALRPGQTIMLKTVPASGLRPRGPTPQVSRGDQNPVRINRIAPRHPAPLPFAMKQYQPPNWKSLPPPPDLKLSKVENGIVISWKIEDVPEDSYEEIASYQLYAYQETSLPPSTNLWKKIGDVKALPLPMACTLTQFMAGYKYYFAVRAVDIRSRLGPFSLPGSILLLSKSI